MAEIRVRLIVHGRVQGVYFRAYTEREANRLGVNGWVRNRSDGTVEILAEGEDTKVGEIIAWSRHGPGMARVENVDVSYEKYTGEFTSFSTKY